MLFTYRHNFYLTPKLEHVDFFFIHAILNKDSRQSINLYRTKIFFYFTTILNNSFTSEVAYVAEYI